MKGIIKQVSEMPKGGRFVIVTVSSEGVLSKNVLRDGSNLHRLDEKTGAPLPRAAVDVLSIPDSAVFLIAVPEFKKVTFEYPWQVERWLCKNCNKRELFAEPDENSATAYWSFGSGVIQINNSPITVDELRGNDNYASKLTWYIKTST